MPAYSAGAADRSPLPREILLPARTVVVAEKEISDRTPEPERHHSPPQTDSSETGSDTAVMEYLHTPEEEEHT